MYFCLGSAMVVMKPASFESTGILKSRIGETSTLSTDADSRTSGVGKNCTQWRTQTNKQTNGRDDSMTNSAQWGRVGEKSKCFVCEGLVNAN